MASYESQRIGKLLAKHVAVDSLILDIGCGYGDKMQELLSWDTVIFLALKLTSRWSIWHAKRV